MHTAVLRAFCEHVLIVVVVAMMVVVVIVWLLVMAVAMVVMMTRKKIANPLYIQTPDQPPQKPHISIISFTSID